MRTDLASVLVQKRGQRDSAAGPVEADHLAVAIAEAAPVRLRDVVQFVLREDEAAGRDRMEQRLPDMGSSFINQHDVRSARSAETGAQLGG